MDSFKDEEDKEESNYVFAYVETVSFADWYRALYDRDQSKDDDMVDKLCDGEQEEESEDGGGLKNRTRKKLGKQVIVFKLKCPQTDCVLSFKSLEQLYQHQKAVHGILEYNCLVTGCSKQYTNFVAIGYHYLTVHRHHTNWTCPHCGAIRHNSTKLRDHIRDSHQFGRFGCWYDCCSFEADLRIKVKHHRIKTHPRFTCSINGCDNGFYYDSLLKQHIQSCHSATSNQSENQVSMIKENDLNLCVSSEPGTSIKVDSKKRPKKTSHPKSMKRQKMDVNSEATNSKVIVLGAKCPQSECNLMLNSFSELGQHQEDAHGVPRVRSWG